MPATINFSGDVVALRRRDVLLFAVFFTAVTQLWFIQQPNNNNNKNKNTNKNKNRNNNNSSSSSKKRFTNNDAYYAFERVTQGEVVQQQDVVGQVVVNMHNNSKDNQRQQLRISSNSGDNGGSSSTTSKKTKTKKMKTAAAATTITTDWFQYEAWLENPFTDNCWNVEDICHSTYRWFYDPLSKFPERQPPFTLELSNDRKWAGRPNSITVTAPNPNMTIRGVPLTSFISNSCTRSPIPNHMVLQSFYNEMLGEFYSRTISWLLLMQDMQLQLNNNKTNDKKEKRANVSDASATFVVDDGDDDEDEQQQQQYNHQHNHRASSLFFEQTQLYLHILEYPQHGKLLDSHNVFTDAFRSNPLLSVTSLLDSAGCQCLTRLLLCGYTDVKNARQGSSLTKQIARNTSVTTVLRRGAAVGATRIVNSPYYATAYRDTRTKIRNLVDSNPFLKDEIENFRINAFLQLHPRFNRSQVDASAFRVVGLTQRNTRRRFLNLPDLLKKCNKRWFVGNSTNNKVVCIETNVEKDNVNPVLHVVMHAACDMLIGIHGAQLTEAIWMKDGSTIVELLPWIPPKGYGMWTRSFVKPSPLGEMFHKTELNHIGYPLQRDSAPYCEDKTNNETEYRACMGSFAWSNRDYQVKPDIIKDLITKFLTRNMTTDFVAGAPLFCDEWQRRGGDRQYVLYNIYCMEDPAMNNNNNETTNPLPSPHHWFWPNLPEDE